MNRVALILAAFPAVLFSADRWSIATGLEVARIPEAVVLPAMASLIDPLTAGETWRILQQEHAASIDHVGSVTANGMDQEECKVFTGSDLADRSHFKVPPANVAPAQSPAANDPGTFYPSLSTYRLEFGTRLECSGEIFPGTELIRISFNATQSAPVGPARFEAGLLPSGLKLLFEKLENETRSAQGVLIVRPGETRLISAAKVQSQPATFELMFLTATSKKVGDTARPSRQPLVDLAIQALPGRGPANPLMWQVPLDLVRIRMKPAAALLLRGRADTAETDDSLREALALVTKGEAELVDWQAIGNAAGQISRAGNTRSRTKYRRSEASDSSAPVTFSGSSSASVEEAPEIVPAHVAPPDVFEAEEEGSTWETQAMVDDLPGPSAQPGAIGKPLVSVYHNSSRADFRHFRRWPVGPDETGTRSVMFAPEFDRRRLATNLVLLADAPMMASFARLPEPDHRFEITWIRASPRKVTPPAQAPTIR